MSEYPLPPWAVYNSYDKHQRILNNLARIAETVVPVANARIASCIIYKKMPISFGICRYKSSPFQRKFGKNSDAIFLHAENDAICRALRYLDIEDMKKCSLYICRVKYDTWQKRNMIFGLAKPCIGCQRSIANFGIKNIYYSMNDEGYNWL